LLTGKPACLAYWFRGNHYRDFLLHDLRKLQEDIPPAVTARMWYMQDGAPAHSSHAVRDVLNNIYHDRLTGKGRPTAWSPCMPDLNPIDFCLCRYLLKTFVYAVRVDNEEALHHCIEDTCLNIRNYPPHLPKNVEVHDVSSRALNLTEDILSTYYKCTLTAITKKLNAPRYMLICTFWYVELTFEVCPTFNYILHKQLS
jgi:hypothetical protein